MELKDKEDIDRVLSALGEQLAVASGPNLDLLVCGGSALQALGLVARTTKDVDVLALLTKGGSEEVTMSGADPLPTLLLEAASKVGRDFRLAGDWINPGPTSALEFGLPEGVLDRAEIRTYGPGLTVRFISRYDQIHFKLYAAVDQGGKHYEDLKMLRPTSVELEKAARWSMTHDVSEGYRGEVKRILTAMGNEDVALRL